ncbi:MAG: hypothetical protein R3Y43_04135 [Alphaproteobacteria bacterium]
MKRNRQPLFIRLSKYTLKSLLNKSDRTLTKFEAILSEEARRASLAHKWVQGVIRLKKAMEGDENE